MPIKIAFMLFSGVLFLVSTAGFIYVKLAMRPKSDSDLDEYHFEFEDHHPQLAQYDKWSRITFSGVIIGMLLIFVSMMF